MAFYKGTIRKRKRCSTCRAEHVAICCTPIKDIPLRTLITFVRKAIVSSKVTENDVGTLLQSHYNLMPSLSLEIECCWSNLGIIWCRSNGKFYHIVVFSKQSCKISIQQYSLNLLMSPDNITNFPAFMVFLIKQDFYKSLTFEVQPAIEICIHFQTENLSALFEIIALSTYAWKVWPAMGA